MRRGRTRLLDHPSDLSSFQPTFGFFRRCERPRAVSIDRDDVLLGSRPGGSELTSAFVSQLQLEEADQVEAMTEEEQKVTPLPCQ